MARNESAEWVEIEVVNWGKYNPRSDKANYTWFRLQNDIMTEPKFFGMSAAEKFIAICLIAEVSKRGGKATRINISWLADQVKVKQSQIHKTIQALVSSGVLGCPKGDLVPATDVTDGRTDVTNETDERDGRCPPPPLVEIWNQHRGPLPEVRAWGEKRKAKADARWSEKPDDSYWVQVVQRLAASPFCCGQNDRKWVADFDFLIQPETQHKALEGKYDDRTVSPLKFKRPDIEAIEREEAEIRRQYLGASHA